MIEFYIFDYTLSNMYRLFCMTEDEKREATKDRERKLREMKGKKLLLTSKSWNAKSNQNITFLKEASGCTHKS